MSVSMLADVDTAARPVRIPKLAVRNRTVDIRDATARPTTATTAATEGGSENGGQATSESSSLRAPSSDGRRRLSDQSGRSGGPGSSGLARREGAQERPLTGIKSVEPAKKKKIGMLGFLTTKEPSQMAFKEFAEAERKKAQEKGSVVNVSGVSPRKLPEHVPKVNSKWDGLPENAKKHSTESRSTRSRGDSTATSGRRPSTTHSSWSQRSDEAKRPFGSLSSRPPKSPQLPQRSSLQSRGTVSSTHSARAPIPMTDVHQAFRPIAVEETPENLPQTFLHPPSPPRQRKGQSPPQRSPRGQFAFTQELPATFGAVPELDTMDGPLPELDSSLTVQELDAIRSRNATPVPKSPITPSVDDASAANYYSDSITSAYGSHADGSTTFFHSQSDTDHEDFARSSPPKQLRQPINFSRRRTGKARPPPLGKLPEAASSGFTFLAEEQPVFSPTLKNSDGRIDPFLTDTFAAQSRQTGRIIERPTTETPRVRQSHPSVDESVRASTSTYVSSNGIHSPVFSTAPTDSTRPSTAASRMSNETTCEGPDQYYTTQARRDSDDSMAPSIAPSTMSAQWTMTPKERLGLGGKIRKGDVLPWETVEDHPDNAEVIVSGPSRRSPRPSGGMLTPTDNKFKRLSYRWGGKR